MPESLLNALNDPDPLFSIATVLVAGIVGGEIFAWMRMPKVTGWIATGILLRWLSIPGIRADELSHFASFNYFVLGYIAFTVGATLYVAHLRNMEKRIGLLLFCEAFITPLVVGLSLVLIGPMLGEMPYKAAILLSAIAIAGAPGTTVLVVQEIRARGLLTRTLVAAVGLIDMVAVAVFVFASNFLHDDKNTLDSLQALGIQFGTTLFIGVACTLLALVLIRTVVGPAFVGPTMVALILGAWGSASMFGTSGGILACTFAGIAVTNLRHDIVRSTEAYLHSIGGVLFAVFFTFAGMKLDFTQVPAAAGLVGLYFFARLIGKYLGAYTAMSLSDAPKNVRNYLGLSLLPHGGVAVGLILLVQNENSFDAVESVVVTVGLAALAINQLLGPSAARFSLVRSGEDHKDRPRLLDFLDEHRIRVGLVSDDKEGIINELADALYATTQLEIDKNEFIKKVLERDKLATTCLGEGLMIPHAILDSGSEIRGVLGLSTKGLDLGAPDRRPIHAVLLLATPSDDRERHLEVLAAFATAITRNINLREQLYHARSAAHAYDILHAEDAEDINYFLEDALGRLNVD